MKIRPILISLFIAVTIFLSASYSEPSKKKGKITEEAALHFNMGQDYFSKADYLSALKELLQAVELDRKNSEAYFLLGTTYYQLKRYTEAEQNLKIAIEMKKGDSEGYPMANNNLGNVYLELGRYDDAIAQFRICLGFIFYQPNFPMVQTNIGIAYMKKGDNAKAEESFRNAIKLDPVFCPAYLNMGELFGKIGRAPEAILEYKKVLEFCPATPIASRARLYLGLKLNDAGKKDEACEQFINVMKESPNSELSVKAGEYIRLLQCH